MTTTCTTCRHNKLPHIICAMCKHFYKSQFKSNKEIWWSLTEKNPNYSKSPYKYTYHPIEVTK